MKKFFLFILVFAISSFLLLFFVLFGVFDSWDLKFADFFYQTINRSSEDIVLVTIDDASLNEIGRWQDFTRSNMASVIESIMADDAAVLGVDINFTQESNEQHDSALYDVLRKYKNIVLVNEFVEADGVFISPMSIFQSVTTMGFANVELDKDGGVRRVLLSRESDGVRVYSFAVEILRNYLGQRVSDIQVKENQLVFSERFIRPPANPAKKFPPLVFPLDDDETFLINYFGRPYSFTSIPFYQVLNGDFEKNVFANKIVLLGATTYTLHDEYLTPVSMRGIGMPGVEIHANVLQTMMTESFLNNMPQFSKIVVMMFLVFVIGFFWLYLRIRYAIFLSLLVVLVYIFITWGAFAYGIILSIVYPIFGIILALIISLIMRYFTESREKIFIRKTFSRYLSEKVVDKIIDKPKLVKLGGDRQNLTVMFSDLGNFTSFSEKIEPEDLVEFMNDYLSEMTDIIFEQEGTLDKYEGDAIMAFWGAPVPSENDAILACKSAYYNLQKFNEMRKGWSLHTKKIGLRIGLNKGEMIVGNMGSEKRFDYTVIGDNVNLAARLEGVNKVYGTNICVSESVYLEARDEFVFRELDVIRVKGKKKPVRIYELVALRSEHIDTEYIQLYQQGVENFRKKDWQGAKKYFNKVLKIKRNDRASEVFLERIDRLKGAKLGDDFDGVFDMLIK